MTPVTPGLPHQPPSWAHCGRGASEHDPVGCRGIHVPGHTLCLAHLDTTARTAYLATLAPGAGIDHRGTTFTPDLLQQLLTALQDPATNQCRLGRAWFQRAIFTGEARFRGAIFTDVAGFDHATFSDVAVFQKANFTSEARFGKAIFTGNAVFHGAIFTGDAWFDGATFTRDAVFREATFTGRAWFRRAIFTEEAEFHRATFTKDAGFDRSTFADVARFHEAIFSARAWFWGATFSKVARFERTTFSPAAWLREATFTGDALFGEAIFTGDAWFWGATFSRVARFEGATVTGNAEFAGVRFETSPLLGPMICGGTLNLTAAVFRAPVTLEAAAREVRLRRIRWESTATLRLRYAEVDLSGAVAEYPVTLAAAAAPFTIRPGIAASEDVLAGQNKRVRIHSIDGVDAAHLALTDVDLSGCHFVGAIHLDQLRIAGRTTFARPPAGWHRRGLLPLAWSWRRTLAEEHHWRAAAAGRPAPGQSPTMRGWQPGLHHPDLELTPGPEMVAALYRQLRKALEDGKNEPGAADFYYGECEMRRNDHTGTTRAERWLLTAYWAISGYGLRASRALAWLGLAMTATVLAMMLWGIPTDSPLPLIYI
ncbi:pentapeptide repeat-containing protein [Streptomyces specialis]|uniref:pentapeptide repeat-containing protein n=1 Tax=Streptomyces specialis TaxID=498367 RepID=UPI00099ED102|nr:pentapeptide repeat-containing protein [Streptomyces specialis]